MAAADDGEDPILVIDALGGFSRLEARSPTLGGSVALRAAQACTPLLEGNAVGRQIVLGARIEIARGLRGLRVARWDDRAQVEIRTRAAVPVLEVRGLLPRGLAERFARTPIVARGRRTLEIFTGLSFRVPSGLRLRVSSSANRRARSFVVREQFLGESAAPVPLVLGLTVEPDAFPIVLEGEIATVVPLPRDAVVGFQRLDACVDAARAHVRFFDQAYFASKKKGATRKYRALTREALSGRAHGPSDVVQVVEAGPRQIDIAPDRMVLRAGMPLSFTWDGNVVTVDVPKERLAALGSLIRAAWAPVLDGPLAGEDVFQGALLYLTKYVTPHPRGEPHFFVKPPALVVTPPGWSTLIDGVTTPGFDVMRGVVRTDVFHAVPAVVAIAELGARHRLREGDRLADLFPSPRSVLERPFRVRPLELTEASDER